MKKGYKVICRDNRAAEDYLTRHKEYIVETPPFTHWCYPLIKVRDDQGKIRSFGLDRFQISSQKEEKSE